MVISVPIPDGSVVDLVVEVEQETTKEAVNAVVKKVAESTMKGILEYSTREEYKNPEEIVHPLVRTVLLDFKIPNFIELKTDLI